MRALLVVVALALTAPAAMADGSVMLIVPGTCSGEFLLGGEVAPCPQRRIIYWRFSNGHVLFIAAVPDGAASFVGEKDAQPKLEEYWLYLSRVRITRRSTEIVANVSGQCVVKMNRAGTLWSSVTCDAKDEFDHAFRLHWVGNGRPVERSPG